MSKRGSSREEPVNRKKTLLETLEATAEIQKNISLILEAKALEAEKSRKWLCSHFNGALIEGHADRMKQVIEIHDQIIDIIDGIVKLENGLASNLKVLLGDSEPMPAGNGGFFDVGGPPNEYYK